MITGTTKSWCVYRLFFSVQPEEKDEICLPEWTGPVSTELIECVILYTCYRLDEGEVYVFS